MGGLGVWDERIHSTIYKMDRQQGLGTVQCLVITYNGKESEKG